MAKQNFDPATLDLTEQTVCIRRVSKTVKGGRIMRFTALMVVGDGNGHVGYGLGKAAEVPDAIRKGIDDAKKNMIEVSMKGTTIPHEIIGEYGAGKIKYLACDLYKNASTDRDSEDVKFARRIKQSNPSIQVIDIMPQLKKQRVIKQPCEIAALRQAALATRDGIVAMMKASKPGMYEYEYRAEFDYALAKNWGMLEPGFPPIISCGNNNFCIHYYGSEGQAKDGDMILNDVGARYDYLGTDVSRGFPCNGKFSEKQRQLYMAAYNTSEYLFSIIKPGMPMHRVDEIAKEYCCEELKKIGLVKDFSEIRKYMWHGGAHHIGFDTHDLVEAETIQPGMVFCVDIGIYVEEWGIGFRVEDNCLVTEDGCENLTAMVPRTIEEIEAVMAEGK